MQIIFASFQGIRKNNKAVGMAGIMSNILKYINEEYKFFISFKPLTNISKDASRLSIFHNIFIAFTSKSYFFFKKIPFLNFNIGKIRFLQELSYDFFLLFKFKAPIILITTAYIPRTLNKNRCLGGINIFIAGNAYDRNINDILKKEEELFNIRIKDPYTYEPRLKNIDNHLKSVDSIITNSDIVFKSYKNYFPEKNIYLDKLDININKKNFINKKYKKGKHIVFCYIAHTVWLKGLIYLLHAWKKLNVNNASLIIGGSRSKIIQKIINSNYSNVKNLKIVGFVPDLNRFYRTSDICIVPSLIDNHPTTISEALYCGLPVITTDGCGSSTLVKDGHNGFVVPPANSDAIAEKIKWFIDNQNQIEAMSQNAEATMESLENSNQEQKLAEHILTIIDELKKEKGIL